MDLFSKILNIYLLFNIFKKFGGGGAQPPSTCVWFRPWRGMGVPSYSFHSLSLKLPNKGIDFPFPPLKLPNKRREEYSKIIIFIPFHSISSFQVEPNSIPFHSFPFFSIHFPYLNIFHSIPFISIPL